MPDVAALLSAAHPLDGHPLDGHPAVGAVAEPIVKDLLASVGIPVPRRIVAGSPAELASAASALAFPVVVKAVARGLVHKSDAGAVELHLRTADEVLSAAKRIVERLDAHGLAPDALLVEEQQPAGVELIVGVADRRPFGLFLAVGIGGTLTEVLHDVAVRPLPLGAADVEAMLASLRGAKLMDGFRGRPPIDREALTRAILAVAGPDGLAVALRGRLAEFEINPLIASEGGVSAVDGRLMLYLQPQVPAKAAPRADFEKLFCPNAVAVVGASAKSPNFGNMFLRYYRSYGFKRPLYAIHPTAPEIDGVPAYPSLEALPEPVDYALIAAPAASTPAIVRNAAGHVRFAQVMSGGFGETGSEGRALEAELREATLTSGVRLLGPNCMGVWSARGRQTFLGSPPDRAGGIAILSQSGSLGGDILKVGDRLGLGFSCLATIGNSIDVTAGELAEWLADDPSTQCIGLYLEDPRDGERLISALAAARDRGKPVVLLPAGLSRQGADAAASHTGAMAGELEVWRGIAAKTGARLTRTLEAFLDTLLLSQVCGHATAGRGRDVLIVGAGGGCNVLATDICDAAGLTVRPVDVGLAERLGREFGAGASFGNPVEVPMGPLNASALAPRLLGALCEGARYGNVIFHVNVQSFYSYGKSPEHSTAALEELGAALAELAGRLPSERFNWVIRNAICAEADTVARLRRTAHAGGVATFLSFQAAAAAIAANEGQA
jgi:acyl-CoA synthetase (NDP forming)